VKFNNIALRVKKYILKSIAGMKIYNLLVILIGFVTTLQSCDKEVSTIETVVHEDESLDRILTFKSNDSTEVFKRVPGVDGNRGWKIDVAGIKKDSLTGSPEGKKKTPTFTIKLTKHFSSIKEANAEMNTSVDTVFHVESKLEKKFRWFYTYLEYSDTYKSLNRFAYRPEENYFTPEDYAFINRLPAAGKPLSFADSLFLERLTEKIFEDYAERCVLEEHFQGFIALLKKNKTETYLIDTLRHHKEKTFDMLIANKKDIDKNWMLTLADSLKIPVSSMVKKEYKSYLKSIENQYSFMMLATNQQNYYHKITVPWRIITTNGDSISGTTAFWRPPAIKFMLNDYSMCVTAKKINYWAVALAGLVVIASVLIILKKRIA
jgi:hypothetical protein